MFNKRILLLLVQLLLVPSDAQTCIESIRDIYTAESEVDDTSVRRTYTLCPRRIYEIGYLDFNFNLQGFNVQPPLPIRPNITIRCGENGDPSNLCWMGEGDLHVDATPFRGISDPSVEGVRLEGIVFIGARKYSVWATKPGDITFKDCEWRDHVQSVVPIMMDWFDGTNSELSVTFDGCKFYDNRHFGRGSHTSLIYANGQQNTLKVVDTSFDDNDMLHNNTLASSSSSLIETLGPLTIERSCFSNNQVGVSSITIFGGSFSNINNFASNSDGPICPFASVFSTLQQLDDFDPICSGTNQPACIIDATSSPTTWSSGAPTSAPSRELATPTVTPSERMTTPKPSPQASSITPSPLGTMAPVETVVRTEAPIVFIWPTNRPKEAPVNEVSGVYCPLQSTLVGLFLGFLVAVVA